MVGVLEEVPAQDGKSRRVPTELGCSLGIFAEERTSQYGRYTAVLLPPQAQQYIYDNIEAIVNAIAYKPNSPIAHQGQPWTIDQDKALAEMYRSGTSVREIAAALGRTRGGISARLKRLGLVENGSDALASEHYSE